MRLIPFTESKRGLYQATLDLLRIRQLTLTSAAFQLINTTNKKGGKNKARVGEKKNASPFGSGSFTYLVALIHGGPS